MAFALMAPAARASDVPNGWQVRAENNGMTFAPVKMNPSSWHLVVRPAAECVQVPAGAYKIVFSYAPSHRPWWLGGFLAGVVILLFNLGRAFRGWRAAQTACRGTS
jgi:hypothetical protein